MKVSLVLVVVVLIGLVTFWYYPVAKLIMSGDRIMQEYPPGYLGMTMSNKNWLLVLTLGTIGGSLGYIISRIAKRLV